MTLIKAALGAAFLLFLAAAPSWATCVNKGGFPFETGVDACLTGTALDDALTFSRGTTPPANADGQGAPPGYWWDDTSVSPETIRYCQQSSGCTGGVYHSNEWGLVGYAVGGFLQAAALPPTYGAPLTLSGVINVTGSFELGGQPVGATALVHPLQGGELTSNVLWAQANQFIAGDFFGLTSSDNAVTGIQLCFGGTAPSTGDVIAVKIAWTGSPAGSLTLSYTATGSEGAGFAATIASAYLSQIQAAGIIHTDWDQNSASYNYRGNADVVGGCWGVNVPAFLATTTTAQNLSTGSGNVTIALWGSPLAINATGPASTELEPGNAYMTIGRAPGAAFTGGIGEYLFQATSSNGQFQLPYGFFAIGGLVANDTAGAEVGQGEILAYGANPLAIVLNGAGASGTPGETSNGYYDSAVGFYLNSTGPIAGNGD